MADARSFNQSEHSGISRASTENLAKCFFRVLIRQVVVKGSHVPVDLYAYDDEPPVLEVPWRGAILEH